MLICHLFRHQTLKEQLASMREKDVIEAMRKIVEMMAKGQDVSDLFPSVVKNVVSKSTEVRNVKLYSYRSIISFSQSIRN